MTFLETVALSCVDLAGFMILCTICGGIYWILEKIGFIHWLRGWLWYFGFIDECPDTQNNK